MPIQYPGGAAGGGPRRVPARNPRPGREWRGYGGPAPDPRAGGGRPSRRLGRRFRRPPGFGGPPIISGGPGTPPGGTPAAGGIGLPLSGAYEQGQRGLQDALSGRLMGIAAQRDQIGPALGLFQQRMGTDQTKDQNSLNTSLADRGVFDSGIRETDTAELVRGYDRARQDALTGAAREYADLDTQAGEALNEFNRELQDLLLQLGGDFAQNPTPAMGPGVGGGGGGGRGGPRRQRGNRRRRGGGGR